MKDEQKNVILTIEDDPLVRRSMARHLKNRDYVVLQAVDGREGLDVFRREKPDLILTDLRMPRVDGLEVLAALRKESPRTPVLVVSGMGTLNDVISALKLGAWDYVTKPIEDMALLEHAIEKSLERARLIQENERYQKFLEGEVERRTRELHQAQKLEAIGSLAGGIAHDFNNILSAIMGFTDLSLLDLDHPKVLKDNLLQIQKAGFRARDLVQQILTFSRKSEHEAKPVMIGPIIKEALKLLQSTIPTIIEIRGAIPAMKDKIRADPTQIHQIIMNLCTNSFHSIGNGKGEIRVSLASVTLDNPPALGLKELGPGKYLKLTVGDTGAGISQENLTRIFEPFYTTKKVGKGTGLGLSVVFGIVKECRGAIQVDSEPGQGTVFDLYFPVIEWVDEAGKMEVSELPRGSETILFYQ